MLGIISEEDTFRFVAQLQRSFRSNDYFTDFFSDATKTVLNAWVSFSVTFGSLLYSRTSLTH